MEISHLIAEEIKWSQEWVQNIIELLDGGNTVPFIARYRKELTGTIDDQLLRKLVERLEFWRSLLERKEDVKRLIGEQNLLTPELEQAIEKATSLTELDDIYRPFRPKRRTKATIAKEKGLDVLATPLIEGKLDEAKATALAQNLIDPEKGIETEADVWSFCRDILAEHLSDQGDLRQRLRQIMRRTGNIQVGLKKSLKDELKESNPKYKEMITYQQYFDYQEPISRMAGHRVLAVNRGEKLGFLSVSLSMEDDLALAHLLSNPLIQKTTGFLQEQWKQAGEDSWKRLISPSLSTEIRNLLTEMAEDGAMDIFAGNLRELLMIPPLRGQRVLALDPAFRTGCKVAVIDETGKLLATTVIYPTPPQSRIAESEKELNRLCNLYQVTVISVGNGTASRETLTFVAEALKKYALHIKYYQVNESGASVYSASPLAAEEFPDLDLTLRSAVSIGRRLQDPLAELVKIDPQSIGVGQYQHDMPTKKLAQSLGGVVEDCVNDVGVDVNTASISLLAYIAGISKPVAAQIVAYREANGAFKARSELKKVPRLGPKAFEQCAGFLRVPEGVEPLDNTRIHPESYPIARAITQRKAPYDKAALGEEFGVGEATIQDIITALENPGYDPRLELAQIEMLDSVKEISDLKENMVMYGIVRNVSAFGAFVDIGVHQDGLVHISQLADKFVSNPFDVVKVGQKVKVRIMGIDLARQRISLSMKDLS